MQQEKESTLKPVHNTFKNWVCLTLKKSFCFVSTFVDSWAQLAYMVLHECRRHLI